jgi:hypothetical protein
MQTEGRSKGKEVEAVRQPGSATIARPMVGRHSGFVPYDKSDG